MKGVSTMENEQTEKEIVRLLKELHLSTIRRIFKDCAQKADSENLSNVEYLHELVENEYTERNNNRINRYMRESKIPMEKNFDSFEINKLPKNLLSRLKILKDGSFLARKENILAFGNPGTGKTHLLCAIGQELIQQGHRVYFARCSFLVEELLKAKKDLKLEKLLKKFSRYEAIIIDDIGYVKYNREEMEVLFTLLAQRYERGSVMITSNLQFSKWEEIFKDPMTTAAAIDRLVHHSVILELNVPSYRMEVAKNRKKTEGGNTEK
jgi:DNA replication protein DnaC